MDSYLLLLFVIIAGFIIYYFCDKYISEKNKNVKNNLEKKVEIDSGESLQSSHDISLSSLTSEASLSLENVYNSDLSLLSDLKSKFSSQYSISGIFGSGDSELSIMKK